MLRVRALPDRFDRACYECGKAWWQQDRPDEEILLRPYAEVRGSIGCCPVLAVLCPICATDFLDDFYRAAGWDTGKAAQDLEWNRDKLRGFILARLLSAGETPSQEDTVVPFPQSSDRVNKQ